MRMRKETRDVMTAFLEGRKCRRNNSDTDGSVVWLFDNRIAWREPDGSISMWMCGHGTVTTRERLNGLCELLIGKRPWHQKKHEQYYDDYPVGLTQVVTVHTLVVSDKLEDAA